MYKKTFKQGILLFLLSIIIGCGDSTLESIPEEIGVNNPIPTNPVAINGFRAVFVDANRVEGLKYNCDGKEDFTNEEGIFNCMTFPVRFYLGNIFLGEVDSLDSTFTVFSQSLLDIPIGATKHPKATQLSGFMQALDEDNDIENGIKISTTTIELINEIITTPKGYLKLSENEIENLILTVSNGYALKSPSYRFTQRSKLSIQDELTLAITKSYTPEQP